MSLVQLIGGLGGNFSFKELGSVSLLPQDFREGLEMLSPRLGLLCCQAEGGLGRILPSTIEDRDPVQLHGAVLDQLTSGTTLAFSSFSQGLEVRHLLLEPGDFVVTPRRSPAPPLGSRDAGEAIVVHSGTSSLGPGGRCRAALHCLCGRSRRSLGGDASRRGVSTLVAILFAASWGPAVTLMTFPVRVGNGGRHGRAVLAHGRRPVVLS